MEPFEGGAWKAAPQVPFMCDWTVLSNGAYIGMFIESIFGARATLSDGLQWRNQWGSFDPGARLENLQYQGRSYRITRKGIEAL